MHLPQFPVPKNIHVSVSSYFFPEACPCWDTFSLTFSLELKFRRRVRMSKVPKDTICQPRYVLFVEQMASETRSFFVPDNSQTIKCGTCFGVSKWRQIKLMLANKYGNSILYSNIELEKFIMSLDWIYLQVQKVSIMSILFQLKPIFTGK